MTKTHQMTATPEHNIWTHMLQRGKNPRHKKWHGRGITVCSRWINSFENFFADMGPRPSPQHSIDRIDNNGNYEPGNCRWATPKEQANNRRSNFFVEYRGKTLSLAEAIEQSGNIVKYTTAKMRLRQYGWPVDAALETPADRGQKGKWRNNSQVHFGGAVPPCEGQK